MKDRRKCSQWLSFQLNYFPHHFLYRHTNMHINIRWQIKQQGNNKVPDTILCYGLCLGRFPTLKFTKLWKWTGGASTLSSLLSHFWSSSHRPLALPTTTAWTRLTCERAAHIKMVGIRGIVWCLHIRDSDEKTCATNQWLADISEF